MGIGRTIEYDELKKMALAGWRRIMHKHIDPMSDEICDCITHLYYKQNQFDGRGDKGRWLAQHAYFFFRNQRRKFAIRKRLEGEQLSSIPFEGADIAGKPKAEVKEIPPEAFRNLTQKEIDILKWRTIEGFTLEEIGTYLGVTRQRVQQIETEILRKIRTWQDSAKFSALSEISTKMDGSQPQKIDGLRLPELNRNSTNI